MVDNITNQRIYNEHLLNFQLLHTDMTMAVIDRHPGHMVLWD